jgi:hypothetical protein
MTLFTNVRTLDLRSVKGEGAKMKRAMLNERREAMAAIASVPHPVSPPGLRPSTASAAAGGRGGGATLSGVPGSGTRTAIHAAHLTDARAELLAAAQAAESQALQKVAVLEDSLARIVSAFSEVVAAGETKQSPYYMVAFPAGPIGVWEAKRRGGSATRSFLSPFYRRPPLNAPPAPHHPPPQA